MNKKLSNVIKIFLILIILLVIATPLLSNISIFNELNKVFKNKLIYILCITIPFLILFIIELTIILKEQKRKQLANMMNLKLEELNKVKDNKELSNTIENTIKSQIKEIDAITLAVDTNTWKTSSCVNYYIIFKYYPTFDKSIIQRLIKVLSNVDKSVFQR